MYFWLTSRCFVWWWNTVSNARYYFSNKTILEGQIKDTKKWAVFHLISKHSLNINFLCIFFMNYESSMWACSQGMSWLNLALHYFASLFDKEPQWQTCNKSFIIFWNCWVQYPEFFKPTCWVWHCCWLSISSMRRNVSSLLTNFVVFHLLVKHCVECLLLLPKQNDFRLRI